MSQDTPWTGKYPTPTFGNNNDKMCDNTLASLGSTEDRRAEIVKTCSGTGTNPTCFKGLKCIDENCPDLYNNLMKNGWGDKETSGTVLNQINNASAENLRDQLKFELCRRASCVPKDQMGGKTGWEWFTGFVGQSWYSGILYILALLPTVYIIGMMLYKSLTTEINNYASVFTGNGNARKSTSASIMYIIGTALVGLLCFSIFSKYTLKTSLGLIFTLLGVFAPVSCGKYGIPLFIVKVAVIASVIYYIVSSEDEWKKNNTVTGVKTASIINGVITLLIGLVAVVIGMIPNDVDRPVPLGTGVLLVLAGIVYIILGSKASNTTADTGSGSDNNTSSVMGMVIMGIITYALLTLGAFVSGNNSAVPLMASFVIALQIFVQIDNTNMLRAVTPEKEMTNLTTAIAMFMTIGLVLFIKKNGSFNDIPKAVTASSFMAVYSFMSGIQTFMGFVVPPLSLSILVLERVMSSFISKKPDDETKQSISWTFLFSGRPLANAFNDAIKKADSGLSDDYLFDIKKFVGTANRSVFRYE